MGATVGVAKQQSLLRSQLAQVLEVLGPLERISATLYERLQPLLKLEVTKLRDRVDRAGAAENPWEELRAIQQHAAGLFTESLGFLGGAVALHAELDGGRCRIVDHLVAKIRHDGELPGHAVSVPAEREYVNVLSSLIRVRFPSEGFWDLPVAVHELGHAVADQLGGGAARAAIAAAAEREQAKPGRVLLGRYEELWADVFATYVVGPAYAATCLRLRFDPSTAGEENDTHPSVDKRAAAILAVLAHLEERRKRTGAIAGSLGAITEGLGEYWLAELHGAGGLEPGPATGSLVGAAMAAFCEVLDSHVPTLRYAGVAAALGARQRLEDGGARPSSVGVIDTMNAAWLARIAAERDGGSVEPLAARGLAWCMEIADG